MNILKEQTYLNTTYSEEKNPKTGYPAHLTKELIRRTGKTEGKMLDLGCGRGEYLDTFFDNGFEVMGFDLSTHMVKNHPVEYIDLEKNKLTSPHKEKYDFVFSKSVIEHMRNPMGLLNASFEALKPGGVAVIMTPSWEYTYWGPFYVDHTHVTPWTKPSLDEAMRMTGFKNVSTEYFFQLPFLWKNPYLTPFIKLFRKIPIPYQPNYNAPWGVSNWFNVLVRFSREPMLLSIAKKE